jgi:16S rRNA (guanine(966)-N(2))-methyltransferase RsmD
MRIRIIAGQARGCYISSVPVNSGIRPILARMRKSLFDILGEKVVGTIFLDLYAGIGTVGLEALSRGAGRVVFIDNQPRAVEAIRQNLNRLGWPEKAQVHRADILSGLIWLAEKFGIIFLGPPYSGKEGPLRLVNPTLELIAQSGILDSGGWIIAQHHKKETVRAPAGYEIFRQNNYGDTLMTFVRRIK